MLGAFYHPSTPAVDGWRWMDGGRAECYKRGDNGFITKFGILILTGGLGQ